MAAALFSGGGGRALGSPSCGPFLSGARRGIDTGKTNRRTPEVSPGGPWEDGGRKGRSTGAESVSVDLGELVSQKGRLQLGEALFALLEPLTSPRALLGERGPLPSATRPPASSPSLPSLARGAQAQRLLPSGSRRACACLPALESSCGASWDLPAGRICSGPRGPFCARVRAWWGWGGTGKRPWKREVLYKRAPCLAQVGQF